MRGNLLFLHTIAGRAFAGPILALGSFNGDEIKEPWRRGRQITFHVIDATVGASAAYILGLGVEGKRRDTGAWEALTNDAGQPLAFSTAKTRGSQWLGVDKFLSGTIPLSKIDSTTYGSIRLVAVETGNQAALVASTYVISDLYENVDTVDIPQEDLFETAGG